MRSGAEQEGPEHRLVLVTGAGASRSWGANDNPMPLMGEWGESLFLALNEAEWGLGESMGMKLPATGEEFEQAIGDFLDWIRGFPLQERFGRLGWGNLRAHEPNVDVLPEPELLDRAS